MFHCPLSALHYTQKDTVPSDMIQNESWNYVKTTLGTSSSGDSWLASQNPTARPRWTFPLPSQVSRSLKHEDPKFQPQLGGRPVMNNAVNALFDHVELARVQDG